MGGLLGTATTEKDGLLSKRMGTFSAPFSTGSLCLNFNSYYELQPFLISVYWQGSYSIYIVSPSVMINLDRFKVKYMGEKIISIYGKVSDGRVFINPLSAENGRLSIQLINESNGKLNSITKSAVPEDFSEISASEM